LLVAAGENKRPDFGVPGCLVNFNRRVVNHGKVHVDNPDAIRTSLANVVGRKSQDFDRLHW
jgi:hypothetical protein